MASAFGAMIPVAAWADVPISRDNVYFVMLFNRHIEKPFAGALFCPVKNGYAVSCRKKTGGYVFGAMGWDIQVDWISRDRKAKTPGAMFDHMAFKGGGQYVMVAGGSGNDVIVPDGATFAINPKPGTIIVLPAQGQSPLQAKAVAHQILQRKYGDSIGQLKFEPISAVKYECSGKKQNAQCKVGAKIDPGSLRRTWR